MVDGAFRFHNEKLQYILAGISARVGNGNGHFVFVDSIHVMFKAGVAQAVTERITRLDAIFVKPTIAYINALCVFFVLQITVSVPKSIGAGIILIMLGPGIRQMAAGCDFPGKNIRQCVAALRAALPKEKDCIDLNFIQDGQIHNTAAVEHQDQLFIVFPQQPQAVLLHIGKQIIPLLCSTVMAFAGLPGENIDSGIRFVRQFILPDRSTGRIGHGMFADEAEHLHSLDGVVLFDLKLQIISPGSHVRIVLFLETVHPKGGWIGKACVFQTFFDGNAVPLPNITAAGAALDGHPAARPVKGDLLRLHRQDTVVFQQHDSFRRGFSCQHPMRALPQGFFRCVDAK